MTFENTINVKSTSLNTAKTEPVILKRTDRFSLEFIPELVNNTKDSNCSVKGKLLYKKCKANENYSVEIIGRGEIKTGQGIGLNLSTSETYNLFNGLKELYKLYEDMGGIPIGESTYTKTDIATRRLLSILRDNQQTLNILNDREGIEIVSSVLTAVTDKVSRDSLKKVLNRLGNNQLSELNMSVNLARLEKIYSTIHENLDNDKEEFWQSNILKEYQYIISQVFACPYTIYQEKAYVGGKRLDNSNGNVCDFIYKNKLTDNIALVEIKTPCTDLIGKPYRNTYNISSELSGAVCQVLNYRDSLLKSYFSLSYGGNDFRAFMPKTIIIIGKINDIRNENNKLAAFENFRGSLNNIVIITYDELCEKIKQLIDFVSKIEE